MINAGCAAYNAACPVGRCVPSLFSPETSSLSRRRTCSLVLCPAWRCAVVSAKGQRRRWLCPLQMDLPPEKRSISLALKNGCCIPVPDIRRIILCRLIVEYLFFPAGKALTRWAGNEMECRKVSIQTWRHPLIQICHLFLVAHTPTPAGSHYERLQEPVTCFLESGNVSPIPLYN